MAERSETKRQNTPLYSHTPRCIYSIFYILEYMYIFWRQYPLYSLTYSREREKLYIDYREKRDQKGPLVSHPRGIFFGFWCMCACIRRLGLAVCVCACVHTRLGCVCVCVRAYARSLLTRTRLGCVCTHVHTSEYPPHTYTAGA